MRSTKLHKLALAAITLAAIGTTPALAHNGCDGRSNNNAYLNLNGWQNHNGFQNNGHHRGFNRGRFQGNYNGSTSGPNMNVNGTIFGYPGYNNYPKQNYNLVSRLQSDIFNVQSRLNGTNLSTVERTGLQNRLANLTSRLAQLGQSGQLGQTDTVNGTLLPAVSNWRTALGL